MVALADVRRWEPAALRQAVGDMARQVQALTGLQDELTAVGTVPGWEGAGAEANRTRTRTQQLADRLEEAAAGAAAVRRAGDDAGSRVEEIRRRLQAADDRAAAEGLRVTPDGTISDPTPPPQFASVGPGATPAQIDSARATNEGISAALARRVDAAEQLRSEYAAIVVSAEDLDVRFGAQLAAATRGEISPDRTSGVAAAIIPQNLHGAAMLGGASGGLFTPALTAPPPATDPRGISDWFTTLNPAQRAIAQRDSALRRLLGDTPTLPADVRQRAHHDGQVEAFTRHIGRPPATPQEWTMAAMLNPRTGARTAADPDAVIRTATIHPVPGQGVVHGGAFISSPEVHNSPALARQLPGGVHYGDNRGFDPAASMEGRSRVGAAIDFESGLVAVRQNPTHSVDGDVAVGDPAVGVEQNERGEVRLRVDAANPLTPGPNDLPREIAWTVRSDTIITPGENGSPAVANGVASQYPSWELYQQGVDGIDSPILQEPQATTEPDGPFENLWRDTEPVGPDPDRYERWIDEHHPEQRPDPAKRYIEEPLLPGTRWGDPWWNYDLPDVPESRVGSDGRVEPPEAGVAR